MNTQFKNPALRRVVIGVDFSRPSLAALEWVARDIAPDAELVLVHAIDNGVAPPPSFSRFETVTNAAGQSSDMAARSLYALANSFAPRPVRAGLVHGLPSKMLAEVAREVDADLVVVGPYSDRPRPYGRFGSTADRLARTSSVPVLVAAWPQGRPTRVLLAVDDVDRSRPAIEWVKFLAQRDGAAVTLMHVLDARWQETYARLAGAREASDKSIAGWSPSDVMATAEARLANLSDDLFASTDVDRLVQVGVPGEEVIAAARASRADMIVMTRRGIGHGRWGIGSDATLMLRAAPCPLLVVVDPAEATINRWTGREESATDEEPGERMTTVPPVQPSSMEATSNV